MNFEESNSMPRRSVLQVFSDQEASDFPEISYVPRAFYPEDVEGTALYNLTSDSKSIALNRINQMLKIKDIGQEISQNRTLLDK